MSRPAISAQPWTPRRAKRPCLDGCLSPSRHAGEASCSVPVVPLPSRRPCGGQAWRLHLQHHTRCTTLSSAPKRHPKDVRRGPISSSGRLACTSKQVHGLGTEAKKTKLTGKTRFLKRTDFACVNKKRFGSRARTWASARSGPFSGSSILAPFKRARNLEFYDAQSAGRRPP